MPDYFDNTVRTSLDVPITVNPLIFSRSQKRAIAAATMGTIIEGADWILYAIFAPTLAIEFFPAGSGISSLLSVLAVFAVGFAMRPIGGAILGALADRHGRRTGLTFSILLMSIASLAIGICPGYSSIGIAAPIILVLARLVQGFSSGGEFGAASTFLVESSPSERRAFAGSWQWVAALSGVLIAFAFGYGFSTLGPTSEFADKSWRSAFVIGAFLGLITLWIRLSVSETEIFRGLAASERLSRTPFKDVIFTYRTQCIRVIGITMTGNLLNYVWIVNYPSFIGMTTKMPRASTMLIGIISVAICLVAIPIMGKLADKVGRRPVLVTFALLSAAWAWPSFGLLHEGMSFASALGMMTISVVILSMFCGASGAYMVEQLPAQVRVTGVALSYALSVALFGGTAPYIITAMSSWGYGSFTWMYLAIVSVSGAVFYVRLPETLKTHPK